MPVVDRVAIQVDGIAAPGACGKAVPVTGAGSSLPVGQVPCPAADTEDDSRRR
jgi:hypothetical protein